MGALPWSPLLAPTITWSSLTGQQLEAASSSMVKLHLTILMASRIAASVMVPYEEVRARRREEVAEGETSSERN